MRRIATILSALLLFSLSLPAQRGRYATFLRAVGLYSEEHFAEAEAIFESLYKADDSDDAVCYYLGQCAIASNDIEKAEKYLSEAVAIDSLNQWYLQSLASVYNAGGKMQQAAELCEKLIKINPGLYGNAYTYTLSGDLNASRMQDSLALGYYRQALEVEPDYPPAQLGRLEVFRMAGKYVQFFAQLEEFLRNGRCDTAVKCDYMEMLFERIDAPFWWVWGKQLSRLVDLLCELHPEAIKACKLKMQVCYINDDTAGVLAQCAEIEKLARATGDSLSLVEALSSQGDVLYQNGDRRKAYKAYEAALKVDPLYAPVLNNFAYYLSEERRNLRKALDMSAATVKQYPDNATYLDTYAWILHLLGRSAEAKPYFKHAMLYGGKDSDVVLDHYAEVLETLGEKDLAVYYRSLAQQKRQK